MMMRPDLRFNETAVFVGVFAVALALRLEFVFQWDTTAYGGRPILDAMVYDKWAQQIAQGHLLHERAFYMSPLYPYVLGLVYAVLGHDLLIAGLFNALLGATTVMIISLVTSEAFGIEAAFAAGLLGAFDMPLIFYSVPAMKEPLALLLLSLFLLFALRALRRNRTGDFFWSGALIGLAALVRGNALILAAGLLTLALIKWRGASKRNVVVFIAAMCLCIVPATLHNYLASGDFVPINYDYGFNLYIGHSPSANGTNNFPPEVSSDPIREEFATLAVARRAIGHDPKPSEVADYWRARALDFILHNQRREAELLWNKMRAFWNTAEAFDNYDIDFIRRNFETLLSWPLVEFWLIFPLAAFGVVVVWYDRMQESLAIVFFALIYAASVMLFYVTDRYRLPELIFLLPFAGAALPFGWKLYNARIWLRLAMGMGLGLFALGFSLLPFPDRLDVSGFDWGTLSVIYAEEGEDDKALDAFRRGLAYSPNVGTQAYVSAAFIEHSLGRDNAAEHLFAEAMKLYPADGSILYSYGRLKAANGDLQSALSLMQKAAEVSPGYVIAYYALASIYDRLGEHSNAMNAVQQGLAVDPHDDLLGDLLARLKEKANTR